MRQFALLLDALSCQQQDTGKRRLLVSYLRRLPDPDRGYGLAALVGGLGLARAKPAMLRAIVADRVDAELFQQSCEYVGDLAETVALIWPGEVLGNAEIGLAEVVERLATARPAELPGLLSGWLDRLAPAERWALLKLASGGLRVGVSAGLARQALATLGGVESGAIEEVWHAQRPPYGGLFAWLADTGPRPARLPGAFRSPMLAEALDEAALAGLDPAAYLAAWQWDGPPVQLVAEARVARLYSHQGEDLSAVFPEIVGAADFEAVLDGELRIARDGQALPFADLRRRLNCKRPTAALLRELPAVLHVRDVLQVASEDLRALPFAERRRRLEAWHGAGRSPRLELSGLLPFVDWTALRAWRSRPPEGAVGLLLQRKDSAYCRSQAKDARLLWQRAPRLIDAVLLYAQGASGNRAPLPGICTFGVWHDDHLVPIGKACLDFADAEQKRLVTWIGQHTLARFGPACRVEPSLVLEIAFESVQLSGRRRAGLALWGPRLRRVLWDKKAAEAGRLAALQGLVAR